jgi:hypothetical protein
MRLLNEVKLRMDKQKTSRSNFERDVFIVVLINEVCEALRGGEGNNKVLQ